MKETIPPRRKVEIGKQYNPYQGYYHHAAIELPDGRGMFFGEKGSSRIVPDAHTKHLAQREASWTIPESIKEVKEA